MPRLGPGRRLTAASRGARWPARLLLAAALSWAGSPARAEDVTVFAAASLTNALDAAIAAWSETAADRIAASYAASSTLARQIAAGAPAALFLSADVSWAAYLEERGLVAPGSRVDRLGNRLVLAAAPGVAAAGLEAALGPGGPLAEGRLALADPDHAPAGRYAREALRTLGFWRFAGRRAARAGSVRAALALVARGEAPLGVVYRTDLAVCPACREAAVFPASSHTPIVYPFVLIAAHRSPAAAAFHAFLIGERAGAVFRAFGFEIRE